MPRTSRSPNAAWLIALWFACTVRTADANPVNAEALRVDPVRAGWSGGIDAGVSLARGNVELLDVGGGANVQHQTLYPAVGDAVPYVAQRVFVTGNGRLAERDARAFVNQAFVHARWTGMWHPRIGTDVFGQYQFNEFLRLQGRGVGGAGVRLELMHHAKFMMWGGSGYMLEHDRIAVLPGANDPSVTLQHRWTNYLALRLAVFEGRLLLQNTFYDQPRFDDFSDFRVLEEVEAVGNITGVLGLGTTVSFFYDSRPPTGVKRTDLRIVSTLRLSF